MLNYLGFMALASKLRSDARARAVVPAERTDRRETRDSLSPAARQEWLQWVSQLPARDH
jgi:hypothetical protein